MENQKLVTIKSFFSQNNVRLKFEELLGKKAQGFITSVLQVVNSNNLLSQAEPTSVYNAAAVAATLDLPINNNLGFAYIVPYNQKINGQFVKVAQFQLGYKGFIQLAQRSGQFQTIASTPIYENQLIEVNPLTGFVFDFNKKGEKVIGYAAYFKLINGFEKTFYMTIEEIEKHGLKYSKNYNSVSSLWKTDFDSMATKTVLKLLLSKFAPLSIEMQKAIIADQGVIKNDNTETIEVDYIDNGTAIEVITKEDLVELFELKKENVPAAEIENIQRIIDNNETTSFKKVNDFLKTL